MSKWVESGRGSGGGSEQEKRKGGLEEHSIGSSLLCQVIEVLCCLHISSSVQDEKGVGDLPKVLQPSKKRLLVPSNTSDVIDGAGHKVWTVGHWSGKEYGGHSAVLLHVDRYPGPYT